MRWDDLEHSYHGDAAGRADNDEDHHGWSNTNLPRDPSRATMEKRSAFRHSILEQTLQHRRLQRHGGMGETGRNILFSLSDRERFGSRHCVLSRTASGVFVAPEDEGSSSSPNKRTTKEKNRLPSLRCSPMYPLSLFREIQIFAEYTSVVRYHSAYLRHLGGDEDDEEQDGHQDEEEDRSSSRAVSTISIAFAPDAQTMASTHGDHSVKITCTNTGNLLESLEGHPRTPWTVKYHPSNPHIVASGCLGFQVRVWDWMEAKCLHMIRLDYAIISLSFHPAGRVLAIASGSRLHFWDYDNYGRNNIQRFEDDGRSTEQPQQSRGALTEVEQRHMLRCVHFPPNGNTLIVGGMNPTTEDPRRPGRGRGGMSGGGMSFYLRMWDFDEDAALHPFLDNPEIRTERPSIRLQRKSLSNPRTFVPRALLYNDGGFDISPDGKVLCACAEYWLPEGVNSAMDLLNHEETEDHSSSDDGSLSLSDEESVVPMSPATVMATPTSTPSSDQAAATDDVTMDTSGSGDSTEYRTPPRSGRTEFTSNRNNLTTPPPSTPPANPVPHIAPLSPPPPPGLRFTGGLGQRTPVPGGRGSSRLHPLPARTRVSAGYRAMPPPPTPSSHHVPSRPPHPLTTVTGSAMYPDVSQQPGRYVPHIVTVSLDTTPMMPSLVPSGQLTSVAKGYRPRLGQLLEACPLDGAKASAVTCVKFSPSADFCLLGYGVREPISNDNGQDSQYHPVTALYRVRGGMTHVSTMLSGDDDVNIARFHPDSGYGFVYGTKQGRVRVLSPRPWQYYTSFMA